MILKARITKSRKEYNVFYISMEIVSDSDVNTFCKVMSNSKISVFTRTCFMKSEQKYRFA